MFQSCHTHQNSQYSAFREEELHHGWMTNFCRVLYWRIVSRPFRPFRLRKRTCHSRICTNGQKWLNTGQVAAGCSQTELCYLHEARGLSPISRSSLSSNLSNHSRVAFSRSPFQSTGGRTTVTSYRGSESAIVECSAKSSV